MTINGLPVNIGSVCVSEPGERRAGLARLRNTASMMTARGDETVGIRSVRTESEACRDAGIPCHIRRLMWSAADSKFRHFGKTLRLNDIKQPSAIFSFE